MRILRAAAYRAVPWKNGLGTTREILKHPAGAAEFTYRLSIAEVTQSCEFSAFPGTDRVIMLLDVAGRLALPPGPGASRLIVALAEGITVRSGGQAAALGRWDTACFDVGSAPAAEIVCQAAGTTLFFHAVITPRRT